MSASIVVTILSRNRGNYLADTIRSWLQQSMKAAKIVVLDNASEPSTVAVVERFKEQGVIMDRCSETISVVENFKRARRHASEPWLLVAHDDDIYHPEFLECASAALAVHPKVGVVVSGLRRSFRPSLTFRHSLHKTAVHSLSAKALANLMMGGYPVNFCAAVYKGDIFRSTVPDWEQFANLFDRPFLLACANQGGALLLDAPVVKYRIHPGQDVRNAASRLPARHAVNLIAEYKRWLVPGSMSWPNAYARRAVYLLSEATYSENRRLVGRFRHMASLGLIGWREWTWGMLCYPWCYFRYRSAKFAYWILERFMIRQRSAD